MHLSAVAGYLADAPEPVVAKKLISDLKRRERCSLDAAASALQEAERSGVVYAWPKHRNSVRYWRRQPDDVIREQILESAGEAALPVKDLARLAARKAHHFPATGAEAAVKALIKEGVLKKAKPVDKTLVYRADSPRTLVAASLNALAQRLRKWDIESFDLPLEQGIPVRAPAPARSAENKHELSAQILGAIGRLQPAPGVPVTVQSLRAAVGEAAKSEFDGVVLALADDHKIFLTTHDHGWALPAAEREQLVWDGGQKLYVAVALRD